MATLLETEKAKLTWVRSIYGRGNAKEQYHHISSGPMNDVLASWHSKQPSRPYTVASPSRLLTCPRVVWLHNKGVTPTRGMTWAVQQRMMLGRAFEDVFARQLKDEGKLIYHWKDNPGDVVESFTYGEGVNKLVGVPDYLLELGKVAVSDAKTSRSDSFGYVPLKEPELWQDWGWYKYRIQLTAYFMLCEANPMWFIANHIKPPEACHLFSYALDDGVVRREVMWEPTEADETRVLFLTRRFNEALLSETMPDCTCGESYDGFDIKFCPFGRVKEGEKMASSCCSDDLINQVKENENE